MQSISELISFESNTVISQSLKLKNYVLSDLERATGAIEIQGLIQNQHYKSDKELVDVLCGIIDKDGDEYSDQTRTIQQLAYCILDILNSNGGYSVELIHQARAYANILNHDNKSTVDRDMEWQQMYTAVEEWIDFMNYYHSIIEPESDANKMFSHVNTAMHMISKPEQSLQYLTTLFIAAKQRDLLSGINTHGPVKPPDDD